MGHSRMRLAAVALGIVALAACNNDGSVPQTGFFENAVTYAAQVDHTHGPDTSATFETLTNLDDTFSLQTCIRVKRSDLGTTTASCDDHDLTGGDPFNDPPEVWVQLPSHPVGPADYVVDSWYTISWADDLGAHSITCRYHDHGSTNSPSCVV